MKNIIREVFEVEKSVEQSMQQAREKASAIRKAAETYSAEIVTQARVKAQQIIAEAVEKARSDARKIRDEKLAEAQEQGRDFVRKNKDAIDGLVRAVTQQIVGTGIGRKER